MYIHIIHHRLAYIHIIHHRLAYIHIIHHRLAYIHIFHHRLTYTTVPWVRQLNQDPAVGPQLHPPQVSVHSHHAPQVIVHYQEYTNYTRTQQWDLSSIHHRLNYRIKVKYRTRTSTRTVTSTRSWPPICRTLNNAVMCALRILYTL